MKEQDFYQLYRKKTIEYGYTPIGRKRFAGVVKTISLIPETLNHIQGKVNGDSTSHETALNLDVVTNRYLIEAVKNKKVLDHTFITNQNLIEGYEALYKENHKGCDVKITVLNGL